MEIFDTRERLLEAAAAEFLRHGFAGANVGKIAGAAGVSKKTVYVHFASKEALCSVKIFVHDDLLLF
ncbi:helix-turn-helix domain-containing protein [Sphingomonas abietis]|uniref:Helix-turn-helix domain containing protein n=1 Tax=Sphingomonas abietis TaxID=3012344 RepID=A0ABY7NWV7_9SPHN|nr:helix-turn-helix domain-containing protein [Sphingomonas abietis]WBO23886.1 helix-turn-helix domain containing protein [Sphingomonas abietis]